MPPPSFLKKPCAKEMVTRKADPWVSGLASPLCSGRPPVSGSLWRPRHRPGGLSPGRTARMVYHRGVSCWAACSARGPSFHQREPRGDLSDRARGPYEHSLSHASCPGPCVSGTSPDPGTDLLRRGERAWPRDRWAHLHPQCHPQRSQRPLRKRDGCTRHARFLHASPSTSV